MVLKPDVVRLWVRRLSDAVDGLEYSIAAAANNEFEKRLARFRSYEYVAQLSATADCADPVDLTEAERKAFHDLANALVNPDFASEIQLTVIESIEEIVARFTMHVNALHAWASRHGIDVEPFSAKDARLVDLPLEESLSPTQPEQVSVTGRGRQMHTGNALFTKGQSPYLFGVHRSNPRRAGDQKIKSIRNLVPEAGLHSA